MPIRLKKGSGSLNLDTANNIEPATTLIESGSLDGLIARQSSQRNQNENDNISESDSQGPANRNSPITSEAINALNNTRLATQSENLWNAIICGDPPPRLESSARRGRRMDFSALWQRQGDCSAEDIAALLTVEDGSLTIDQDELDRRIDMILGPAKQLLGSDQKALIASSLVSVLGGDSTTASVIIGGVQTLLSDDHFEDAQSLTELLSAVANDDDLAQTLDLAAEFAVMDALINQAVQLGLPQAADNILDDIEDDDRRRRLLLRNLRLAAINSNLDFIQRAINSHSRQTVLNRVPDIVSLILKFYSWGLGVSSDQYPQKRDVLINLIDSIDPDWHITQHNGQTVANLAPYTRASRHARTLLKMSPIHFVSATIAPNYPSKNVKWAATQYYPQVMLY